MSTSTPPAEIGRRFRWTNESAVLEETALYQTVRYWDAQLEQPAVLKLFRGLAAETSPELAELLPNMWRAEARSLFRVRATGHSGIVQLLAADHDPDTQIFYIAWEDLYPDTLRGVLDRRLTAQTLLRLADRVACAYDLADALLVIHALGIVHRDIRPETICVWPTDRRLALGQFGQSVFLNSILYSRQRAQGQPPASILPDSAIPYASPERLEYLLRDADVTGEGLQSDIYSLGMVLLEWMVGRLPPVTYLAAGGYDQLAHRTWHGSVLELLRNYRPTHDEALRDSLVALLSDMVAFDLRERLRSSGECRDRWRALRDALRRRDLFDSNAELTYKLVISESHTLQYMGGAISPLLPDNPVMVDPDARSCYGAVRDVVRRDLSDRPLRIIPTPDQLGSPSSCIIVGERFVYHCESFRDLPRGGRPGRQYDHLLWLDAIRCGLPANTELNPGLELRLPSVRVLTLADTESQDHVNVHKRMSGSEGSWTEMLRRVRDICGLDSHSLRARRRGNAITALRLLLESRKFEAALETFAYRQTDSPTDTGKDDPAEPSRHDLLVEPDADAEKVAIEADPALGALRRELETREPLPSYVTQLLEDAAERRKQPEFYLARTPTELGRTSIRVIADVTADGRRVRLRPVDVHATVPERGWLRPTGFSSTVGQEQSTIERFALDDFRLDALLNPALARVRVGQTLRVHDEARLSPSKLDCLRNAVAVGPIYVLKGPPGTGKTETVAALVEHVLEDDPLARILICSQAHRPLDHLLAKVSRQNDEISVLRIPSGQYSADSTMADFTPDAARERLLERVRQGVAQNRRGVQHWSAATGVATENLRTLLDDWSSALSPGNRCLWEYQLTGASVIAASCVGAYQLLRDGVPEFDWVVVEEAGRAHATELLIPLSLGRQWFLLGDHDQIGPHRLGTLLRVVDSRLEAMQAQRASRPSTDLQGTTGVDELRELVRHFAELFASLYRLGASDQRGELAECFRMHPAIVELVGGLFYAGGAVPERPSGASPTSTRLVSAVTAAERIHGYRIPTLDGQDCSAGRAIVVIDTSLHPRRREEARGFSKWNPLEVELVRTIYRGVLPQFPAAAAARGRPVELTQEFAVISMYAEQRRRLIAAGIPETLAHTVTSFQGQEASVVILSLVRSNTLSGSVSALGSIVGPQELNVALSRARDLLVIIGDLAHIREFASESDVAARFAGALSSLHCVDARQFVSPGWVPVTRGGGAVQ